MSSAILRTHLAALAQWHKRHGFLDPTKDPKVRDVLRGIQAEHPRPVKQADALQLQALEECMTGLQAQAAAGNAGEQLRALRDRALILLGFWRSFRADDLCSLRVEHIQLRSGERAGTVPGPQQNRSRASRTDFQRASIEAPVPGASL